MEARAHTRAHFLAELDRAVAAAEEDLGAVEDGWLAVAPWCKQLVTEQVARVAVNGSARPYLDDLVRYIQLTLMTTVSRQRPYAMMRLPGVRRSGERVKEVVDGLVEESRRTGPGPVPDLIDDLLVAAETDPGRYGPADIRLAVKGAFIAGMDTAANTLAFAIHELARQPAAVDELVAEMDAAFAEGVTAESLQRMPKLMLFLFEVLRLHPIAPALRRHLVDDIEFAGHRLNAGTPVIIARPSRTDCRSCSPNLRSSIRPGSPPNAPSTVRPEPSCRSASARTPAPDAGWPRAGCSMSPCCCTACGSQGDLCFTLKQIARRRRVPTTVCGSSDRTAAPAYL